MDYDFVILDNMIVINDRTYSNFVWVIGTENGFANVLVSNTDIYCNVFISDNDVEQSIKDYFKEPIEV